jgi:hypothetical protein
MSSIIKVDTIQNQSGANIISESSNTITVGASGDTITVPSGATLDSAGAVDLSSSTAITLHDTMKNTPAWKMGKSGTQPISYNTVTLITFDTSLIDTDSGVNTSTNRYTIPTGKGGTYIVHSFFRVGTGTNINSFDLYLYKNGSSLSDAEEMASFTMSYGYNTVQATGMIELSAGDYIQMYTRQASVSGTYDLAYSAEARFWGYRLIGA